jgi:hypothetical protein
MILRLLAAVALIVAEAAPAGSGPVDSVSETALRRHIAVLADDAMAGRKPGTPGGLRAAAYVAAQMRAAGLRPAAADGGWYQNVSLVERRQGLVQARWRAGGREIPVAADDLLMLSRDRSLRLRDAPLWFGGHGRPADLQGADLKGAILLLLPTRPEDLAMGDVRRSALAGQGVAAVITLGSAETLPAAARAQYRSGRTLLAGEPIPGAEGMVAGRAWRALVQASGRDPAELVKAAAGPQFRPVRLSASADIRLVTPRRHYRSVNVIGRIEGGERAAEAIVYLAHWDHLGICRPRGVADRICNGAVDNASGVALMLEIARALAEGPQPKRSLIFVATTAEEMGLLGARAFLAAPSVPLPSIRAALNIDTIAIAPRGMPVSIVGRGRTPLDPFVDEVARRLGRAVSESRTPDAYIARQDGWEFTKRGIPAIMASGAFTDEALFSRFLNGDYHGPKDDLSRGIELGGAVEDGALLIALGRLLADPARFPGAPR